MIQNWIILVPLVYIVLFIIGAILNSRYDWELEDRGIGFILIILCAVCVIWFFLALFVLINTINGESVMFAQRQAEYKTVVNILETSTDVVNSDIYVKAFEYNSLITETQTAIHNPAYSIMSHFLKCDWDSLPLIVLN